MINWLVFITAVESVYRAVRADALYKADYVSSLKGKIVIVSRLFIIYLHPSHERETHSTELPTRTHAHSYFLLPQKLPLHQAYTLRTQEANTPYAK